MGEGMSVDVLVRYAFMMLGIMVLFFLLAVITPLLAKLIDKWIANYREKHSPLRDPTYSVRSIYELPPKKQDKPEKPAEAEQAQPSGSENGQINGVISSDERIENYGKE